MRGGSISPKEGNELAEIEEYVTMPQNDKKQIEQIAREYEGEPAKGLAHGLQKDAIQNAVGARLPGREPVTYRDWRFSFELLRIDGRYALSFWDEGTTGLTGDILDIEQIEERSMRGTLTADQNLSRFLTRFESGGGIGPGSFGRGKLIFQAASESGHILCDSLRNSDRKYIAFERKIIGTRLKQTRIPHEDDKAKDFVRDITGGVLTPLSRPGTRITVLDLEDGIVHAIKNSFEESGECDYSASFIKMIEETWWEILHKFNAGISLIWKDHTLQANVSNDLHMIANAKDREERWRIYEKKNFPMVVGGTTYKIKELRIAVSPQTVDEELRGIWIQRKRMKIGLARVDCHTAIKRKLCGYVILDDDLEDEVDQCENTTHYGFNWRFKAIRQLKRTVENHLGIFQEEIGLRTRSRQVSAREDMYDAMREINEIAEELGLSANFSLGSKSKRITMAILSFRLPNPDSIRVDPEVEIGPIEVRISNKSQRAEYLTFVATAEQQKEEGRHVKELHRSEIDIDAKSSKEIDVDAFEFDQDEFEERKPVSICLKVFYRNTSRLSCQTSRLLWLGTDEPEVEEDDSPFVVITHEPLFPHPRTRRVELEESILNIGFRVSNRTPVNVNVNADLIVRRAKYPEEILHILIEDRDRTIYGMTDWTYACESLDIDSGYFGELESTPKDHEERKCEIFFSIRLGDNVPEMNLTKGHIIAKKRIAFYLGVDPPGDSIFDKLGDWEGPEDGRRSYYTGDRASGFGFMLNVEHSAYKFAEDSGEDVKIYYIKEEMLKQAYAIMIDEGEFHGVAESFAEDLDRPDLTPVEAFLKIEELIGQSLMKVG